MPKAHQSSPGGAGLGCSPQVYLDGGHLCVSSPAEALELQRVVAEAHGPAGRRGAFLQLEFQVVKVREIMVPCRSGEKREHHYLPGYLEGAARGHLCQARGRCDSSPDDEVPIPVVAEDTVGGRARQGAAYWVQVGPRVLCRQRQAPLRSSQDGPSAPPTSHRQPAGGSACLHSRRVNELLVANQRRIPAGGEPGATIFIPLYPFSHLAPDPLGSTRLPPQRRAISRRLREQGLQTLTAGRRSPATSHSLAPSSQPCQHCVGWLRGAGSPPLPLPMDMVESGQPHVSMPALSQQEEGAQLQGCDQWSKHQFLVPKGVPYPAVHSPA